MSAPEYREVPYNYTSASDREVVLQLLGETTWNALEQLRERRVTGRSARILFRLFGDLFVLRRNPYHLHRLAESQRERRRFFAAAKHDLAKVLQGSKDEPLVSEVVATVRQKLQETRSELHHLQGRRRQLEHHLGAIVGKDNVHFDPFTLVSHATDATDWRLYLPLAVVRPEYEHQVAPLLATLKKLGIPAIPRGAGTGLTGGAVPVRPGCVVVNTERLNRIRGVREQEFSTAGRKGYVLEVEAGVVTDRAIEHAASQGLVFATDPTSAWACTVGGNLAENAGGKKAVLWGTAIDNVLSYRMALSDGSTLEVERVNHPLRKILPEDEVRFRITHERLGEEIVLRGDQIRKKGLWKDITNKALGGIPGLQKEGTDGLITSACFVLHAAYEEQQTVCLEFFGDSMDEAAKVILELSEAFPNRGDEALMALEHFDHEYVRAIGYRTKAPRDDSPRAVLLIDIVGHTREQIDRAKRRLEELLARYPNSCASFARSAEEATRYWLDRKKLGAIAKRTNAFKLNEDIVLPLSALADFARFLEQVNLEEERVNQLGCVEAARELMRSVDPGDDREWFAAKLPRAEALCERFAAAIRDSSALELREGQRLQRFRDELRRLLAGYEQTVEELDRAMDQQRSRQIVIATHMHAGDGNVHVNIPVFSNDRAMMNRASDTANRVMLETVRLGGVVSGEHGIGITKLPHLEQERIDALIQHRARWDASGIMNPGKLEDRSILPLVYTPSFNLLELEAKILQYHSLKDLADRISQCVRCGKCATNCCVRSPEQNLFYHPRNKNLAIGSLIEALLYQAQRSKTPQTDMLQHLQDVADHCTICHKCYEPCPVKIDTGKVSIIEREILAQHGEKRLALATRLTLSFLNSTQRVYGLLFRWFVLILGTALQRIAERLLRPLPLSSPLRRRLPLALLNGPISGPTKPTLTRTVPPVLVGEALILEPEGPARSTVFYFPGCGSERLYSQVGRAAVYLLLHGGHRVVLPPASLCCGFPSGVNAQDEAHARRVLANTIVFSQLREMLHYLDFDAVVVSCGTCREALRATNVEDIFHAPLEDVSHYVVRNGEQALAANDYRYHRPCHDSLDGRIQDLFTTKKTPQLIPHCCSEAGTMALSRPDITVRMLLRKRDAILETLGPSTRRNETPVLTNCPSCLQGLGRQQSTGIRPLHVAEALARQIGGEHWEAELPTLTRNGQAIPF
jgi:FAD/FMN-containing dehydrogenase/Fe-S oxidoreductase